MYVKSIDNSERWFQVRCRNAEELSKLLALADCADIETASCCISKPSYRIPTPPPKPSHPSDASDSSKKKADYLESIQHLTMEYARGLMTMDVDEPDLIMDLLRVSSLAKAAQGKYRMIAIAVHPHQPSPGAGSSVGMTVPVDDSAEGTT